MRGSCARMGDTGDDRKHPEVRRGKGSRVRSGGKNRPWISQATGKPDPPPWWGAERVCSTAAQLQLVQRKTAARLLLQAVAIAAGMWLLGFYSSRLGSGCSTGER